MYRVIMALAASLLLTACATQRFGRQVAVSNTERRLLSCEQIEIEIAKTEEFLKDTSDQNSKFTGKDVLGFLGDFGVGNSMEYSDAIRSGINRLTQLRATQTEKGCAVTSPQIPIPELVRPAAPAPKPKACPGCGS